jgi:ribosomal protein RSM22 (predicted rRNA methylase)
MLVLVEPGTPAGSANIQEARATVLQYEARRVSKLQQRIAAGDTTAGREAGDHHDRSSSSSNSDHNLPAKAASRWFGAHVVSPCPHDGPCPLAVAGSKSWCHFGTRFQRPGFMQEAKAPPGRRVNAADFQDERYSYVVLR